MNVRVTIGLLVVLLVLLAIVFLQHQPGAAEPTPIPTVAPAESLIEGVEMDQIERLEVRGPEGQAQLVLERGPDEAWLLVTPTGAEPISATITSQLDGLIGLTSRNTLPSTANPLEAYGLDLPAHSIVVVATAGEANHRFTLNVGRETPTADGYYVMREGDPRVFVVLKFPIDSVLGLVDTVSAALPSPPSMTAQPSD